MQVTFYSYEKKQNSTIHPVDSGTSYDCIIKDNCSILAPTIKLDTGLVTSPIQYNYAYISDWNRYYYVNDWVFSNRLWQAKLCVDVLATYKTEIGNYEGYILRSSSRYDGNIADTTYPQKVGITGYQNKIQQSGDKEYKVWLLGDEDETYTLLKPDDFKITSGYYYVTILGSQSGSSSANKYNTYVMSYNNYAQLMTALFNTDYSSYSKGTITNDVYKYLVDPLQWIVSVKWCPFRVPGYTLESKTIVIGGLANNSYTVTCAEVTGETGIRVEHVITGIPTHPQYSTRGKWVNTEPYMYVELDCQPFGSISLDRSKIPVYSSGTGAITIMWDIDIHTGEALARIYGTNYSTYEVQNYGPLLGTLNGNYMVDVPIAQTKTNMYGLAGLGVSAVGNYITNNSVQTMTSSALQIDVGNSDIHLGVSTPNEVSTDLSNPEIVAQSTATSNEASLSIGSVLSNIGNVLTGANLTVSTRGTMGSYLGFRDPFIDCWWTSMVDEDNEHSGRPLCAKMKLNLCAGFILCRDGDISLDATVQEKNAVGKYLTGGFFYE